MREGGGKEGGRDGGREEENESDFTCKVAGSFFLPLESYTDDSTLFIA